MTVGEEDKTAITVPKGIAIVEIGEDLVNINGNLTISDEDGNNEVNVLEKMNTNTENISSLIDELYYKAGEKYSFEVASTPEALWLGGTFTTSRTQIAFSIFTPKNMKYINSITCEEIDLTVRSNLGNYIANSVTDKSKVTAYKSHDNVITLIYTLDTAAATSIATNNTPAAICLKSITLSLNE